jgi:8-oxo-dGTP pyrophosphatase MutT (NUDIX family)
MKIDSTKLASCVIAIHPQNGRILAATRRGTYDDWGIIGGKQDLGEDTQAAAMREFAEETNHHLRSKPEYLGTFIDEEGWAVSVFVVTDRAELISIAAQYSDGVRENEPGIWVGYVPFSELTKKTFAKFNTDLVGPLLAFLV